MGLFSQLETFVNDIGDNVGDVLRGDIAGGLGGLFENSLDFITLGFYSKVKQVIDSLQPPDLPAQTYQARSQMGLSAQTPRQFVYGRCRIGGQLTYWTTTGADSEFMHMVVTLAPHELRSISQVYLNDELAITVDNDGDSLYLTVADKFNGAIARQIFVANPRTAASSVLVDEMPEWTTDHIGRDHAYIYLKLNYNKEAYSRGMPNISCVVRGKKVYDPRTLTTSYSTNHALVCLDYILSDNGLRATIDEIDLDSFIAGADVCDEQVAGIGGTESRYEINGTLEYSASPIDNLMALADAGHALIHYEQGKWQYVAGTYTSPIMDLDESDLVGGISVMTGPSKSDLVNTVKGSFLDPRQDFEVVQFPQISIDTYVARDKEVLSAEISAPFTITASAARRIGKLHIEQSRFGVRMQAAFKFVALKLLPGDRVTFSSARLGWDKKIFRVVGGGQSISLTGGIDLTLAEDSPDVWSWTEGEALDVNIPPALSLPDSSLSAPLLFAASEELYATNVQNIIKTRVTLTWERGGVRSNAFNIEAKKAGETEFRELARGWTGTQFTIEDSELGEFEYRVQGVSDIGRLSPWANLTYEVLGKNAPPADVPTISAIQRSYGIDVSWQAVPDADVQEYEVRLDQDFGEAGSVYTGRQLRFTDIRRADGTIYYIKALDTSGNYSANATSFAPTITGPSPVSSLALLATDSQIQLRWASAGSVYPVSTYRLYEGDMFDTAVPIGESSGTFEVIIREETGTYTFWVEPVDAAGNVGGAIKGTISVDGAQDYILRTDEFVDFNQMDTLTDMAIGQGGGGLGWDDETELDWSSDTSPRWDEAPSPDLIGPVNITETFLENMTRSGLTSDTDQFWNDETGISWDDETNLQWNDIGGDPYQVKLDNGFTHFLDPSTSVGVAERIIDFGALIPNTRITVNLDYEDLRSGAIVSTVLSTSNDGISWNDFPENQFEITASNFQYLKININIDATGTNGLVRINSIRYKLDIKQKTDQGQAQIFASDYDAGNPSSSGTVVVLNKPFLDLDSVVATAKANDAKIVVTNFDDVGNQDRFRAVAFDRATGNAVDATISWNARGS